MAQTIKLRRSATPSAVPTTAQLALGELAINTYDGKLYMKKNVSGVETIVDITSGTTGGSSVTVSTTAPVSPSAGDLWWDSTNGLLKIYYNDGTSSQWVDAFTSGYPDVVPVSSGGTGKTTSVAAFNALQDYTTTATSGGTTTLTNTSTYTQHFTGTSTHTVVMPDATTVTLGWSFKIYNKSSQTLTLQSSGGGSAWTLAPSGVVILVCTNIGTAGGSWDYILDGSSSLTVPIALGGTGRSSAPSANAALTGFTTTATAGGTTTLTNTSSVYQEFTGASNQTIQLPSTATLAQGWSFHIVNNSTGTLTVQTSTAVSLGTIPPGVTMMPTVLSTVANTAAAWETGYTDFSTLTGTGSNVLATSPTVTNLSLAAGTTSLAPLDFTAGTNLATAVAGAVEYDGTCLYFTPFSTSRSVVKEEQLVVLGSTNTLTSQTGAQPLFDNATANGRVDLAVGTYQFECFYALSSMSGTSGSFGFALVAGTAIIGSQGWTAFAAKNGAFAGAGAGQTSYNTAANTTLTTASTNTSGHAFIKGFFRITTAGTIVPSVSLGVAAAAVVNAQSYFKVSPVSPTNAAATNITVGNWS